MKNSILFNALIYAPDGTGISRYAGNLVKQFIDCNANVDILLRNEYKKYFKPQDNLIFIDAKINNSIDRIIIEQWKLRNLYNDYKLIHFPDYAIPVLTQTNTIATIHDLAMISMRKMRTLGQNVVKNILFNNTIYRSSAIIFDSKFIQSELMGYYPNFNKLNKVIHLGVDKNYNIIPDDNILQRLRLKRRKYLLYVGTIAPHKNIKNLILAFSKLKIEGYNGKLVIAGAKGWLYDDVFDVIKSLKLENTVIFSGYVTDLELESLYRNAISLVNISLYEGFGLPPLEAMIRYLPVIVSDIPVFHEVVGECGCYCNPNDVNDIYLAMKKMINDSKFRNECVIRGREKVKVYSWEDTAHETLKFYNKLLNSNLF